MTARSNNSLSLSMSSNSSDSMQTKVPEAKSPYNRVTHSVRRIIPTEMACKLGCNGTKCKYDNSNWPKEKMAINGLYSHWITDDILAMARPRAKLINDSNLIHEMKRAEIRSIFNLQSRNEHKDCGDGILKESGFSYDPIDFSQSQIFYYNYELEDFSVASTKRMIDMVKVLCFSLTEGKAAIHCHAGLGRTGLFIACYLVYTKRLTADEAIFLIREKRPGSVQMTEQIKAIKDFENYLKPMRVIYVDNLFLPQSYKFKTGENDNIISTYEKSFNLRTFLSRQRNILHGVECKRLKYIPKIIHVCGEQIKKITSDWKSNGIDRKFLSKFHDTQSKSKEKYEPNIIMAKVLCYNYFPKNIIKHLIYYQKAVNESDSGIEELMNESDPSVLIALIWSWLNQLDQPVLNDQNINILIKRDDNGNKMPINWKDLDKGSIYTINYLISIVHYLLPLPFDLEDELCIQLVSNLSQMIIKNDLDNTDNEQNMSLLNTTTRMKKSNVDILCKLIKDLIQKPVFISDKTLGKFNFNNNKQYDYEERVSDDELINKRKSRSRLRKNNSN